MTHFVSLSNHLSRYPLCHVWVLLTCPSCWDCLLLRCLYIFFNHKLPILSISLYKAYVDLCSAFKIALVKPKFIISYSPWAEQTSVARRKSKDVMSVLWVQVKPSLFQFRQRNLFYITLYFTLWPNFWPTKDGSVIHF